MRSCRESLFSLDLYRGARDGEKGVNRGSREDEMERMKREIFWRKTGLKCIARKAAGITDPHVHPSAETSVLIVSCRFFSCEIGG